MIGLGLNMGLGLGAQGGSFSPASLNAKLYANWDAETPSSLTLSGANLTTWTDTKSGYAVTQAVAGAKPVYSDTSFNGRPGIAFDGTDDVLIRSGANPFPPGAAGWEIWALIDQQTLAADTSSRAIFVAGDTVNNQRILLRRVQSGVSVAGASIGTAAGNQPFNNSTAVDFVGRHVVRLVVGPTQSQFFFDGAAGNSLSIVPASGGNGIAIGSALGGGAAMQAILSQLCVTDLLNPTEAASMTQYFKLRGGIA